MLVPQGQGGWRRGEKGQAEGRVDLAVTGGGERKDGRAGSGWE